MKRNLILLMMTLLPFSIFGQSYGELWKKVDEAAKKDLPKTQIDELDKIVLKAERAKDYGQLLAARLMRAGLQTQISPDSLDVEKARLKALAEQAEDKEPVLAAVYDAVLGKIGEKSYFQKALSHPELLARHKASAYQPLVEEHADSKLFNNDLLHVIGIEAGDWQTLFDYYNAVGNRPAACVSAARLLQSAEGTNLLARADSLLNVYGDLPEASELAIQRYRLMTEAEATAEEKINYIDSALSRWGTGARLNALRNEREELTRPSFNVVAGSHVTIPNRERTVLLQSVRNVKEIKMSVHRLNIAGDTQLSPQDDKDYRQLKRLIAEKDVCVQTRTYAGKAPYDLTDDSLTIAALPVGVYLIDFSADGQALSGKSLLYFVSDVYVMWEQQPDNMIRYVVVNATSGQPLGNASIRLTAQGRYGKAGETRTLSTDNRGEVLFNSKTFRPADVYACTATDKACPNSGAWTSYNYYDNSNSRSIVNVYTDRHIYRPGQEVHAAAVVYQLAKGVETAAIEGLDVTFELRDANNKVVGNTTAKTDRFGTASADFTLPQGGLTGRFTVKARCGSSGSAYLQVEEYKRPTFQLEFSDYQEKYEQGDTVVVQAHARTYAGVPVQGAHVKYTVTRRRAFWWWRFGGGKNEQLAAGEAVTDAEGGFRVEVPMLIPDVKGKQALFYNFTVEAQVTDLGGESHSGSISLPLGTKATAFGCDLPEKVLSDSLKQLTFSYRNAAGKEIDGRVSFSIDGTSFGTHPVNAPIALNGLKSGSHRLEAVCGSDTIKQDFVVFSMSDKRPAAPTSDWFYVSASEFPRDGKPVYVQVGSSDADQHIVYSIFSGKRIVESGVIDQSNALTTRTFIYKEEYGTGLTMTFAWVKEGVMHRHEARIQRPLPDKRLQLEWKTFRDRLTPGQQEEWTLSVKQPDGKPADAQLLATLYDKSLDQIQAHAWNFRIPFVQNVPYAGWGRLSFGAMYVGYQADLPSLASNGLVFSRFHDKYFEGFGYYGNGFGRLSKIRIRGASTVNRNVMMAKQAAPRAMADVSESWLADAAVEEKAMMVGAVTEDAAEPDGDGALTDNENQLRENLNETAFFYPQLATDANGRINIKFMLPESITTWRFMGLAHDAEMRYGSINGEVVAKKTVMIQPNVPRFVREGDRASVAARLFNTSEKSVSGVARLELIDPETDEIVYAATRDYAIEANGTAAVDFEVDTRKFGSRASILIARTTANGTGYSDGEQHYLPILPDREMVVNTVPFTQHGAGTKTIDLTKLFPAGTTQQRLTVEYTNNPSWLMIQALPYVGNPNEHNAISLVSAYYANALARQLLNSSPKIKQTFDLWRMEKGEETSLMSSLQKDQSLKELVLNETPWVMDAEQETSQKQALVRFFNENTIDDNLKSTLENLRKLQNPDGSWSWWAGMEGSAYMTTAVAKTLVRQNMMIGEQAETAEMLDNAFRYMALEMSKEVMALKKLEKKSAANLRPSELAVDMLYTYALDGRPLSASATTDKDYLVRLLAKQTKEFTIYGKAVSSIILAKNGYGKKASEYLQSIREYTVYTEEMGRYFDTPKASYSWRDYKIPTEVAAIEALKLIEPTDRQTVEDMQRWLLQEKRTQAWTTPVNSVNAVYAFSDNGKISELDAIAGLTTLKLDEKQMELPQLTAGLGYVKTVVEAPKASVFTAEKASSGTSWGAVYAQFMQPVAEIDGSSSGISVTRDVLKDGKPVTNLKVGDKVSVRITVKSSRDYDFVQIVDKRAACLEPAGQLSGYHGGYYCAPKDYTTNYYFDRLPKGTRVIETEYYVDRSGAYQSGTCTVQCAYAPEFGARVQAVSLTVEP
ncbi:MAG: alpha-2-macroglobulin [Prevotella sp.]|nr:alpha-2-macroglobulin [Prevotella sp.]